MSKSFQNPNNPLRKQTPTSVRPRTASAKPAAVPTIQATASRQDEQNFGSDGQYNPARPDSRERLYNRAGELNASDNKDAFAQIRYLQDQMQKQSPFGRMARTASVAEQTERRKVLAAALNDAEGFALVGQELALPIKMMIDYEGWVRKVYRVRTLAQGELFRIAKDVRASAWVIGQDGQAKASQLFTNYILPDEAMIASFVEVNLMELYQANFDMIDRGTDTARQEIELEEDKRGVRLLDRAALTNVVSTYTTMSLAVLENLRLQVERNRLMVDKFLINRAEIADIQINISGNVDPVTQREWNLSGYIGQWLGARFMTATGVGVEEVVPAGTIYAVTAPEYLGEMGIRMELFSEPYSQLPNHQFSKGFGFAEIVGFGIPASKSVAKAIRV